MHNQDACPIFTAHGNGTHAPLLAQKLIHNYCGVAGRGFH